MLVFQGPMIVLEQALGMMLNMIFIVLHSVSGFYAGMPGFVKFYPSVLNLLDASGQQRKKI
jgi:hypothetical protein